MWVTHSFNFLQHLFTRLRASCVVCFLTTFHPTGWFTSLCSLLLLTLTYNVQYWNERSAEWKRVGSFPSREEAREAQYEAVEQTAGTVRFRVTQVAS